MEIPLFHMPDRSFDTRLWFVKYVSQHVHTNFPPQFTDYAGM